MADIESDRLELALDNLLIRHCSEESTLKSKEYCVAFCQLVEEHTGRWQVPLPQLKVLRAALCSFTTAATAFPAECQHIHHTMSSLAVSFFELMLFFSKEQFVEYPLKDIIDAFQACHSRLIRHNNIYMQQLKQVIKVGGPWESRVLQEILHQAPVPQADVEEFLNSEASLFLELRVRYLQAWNRLEEAMALAKSCLEHCKASKQLYFHQAYLTCLYKASLHEHLHKEMADIDGHDAVEIICNTESVEEDELLLSLCKAFLNQQLANGDMYYIWDLVFLWSRLFLRAHPSGKEFLAECQHLASTAINTRAIFPFIKVVHAELGSEGEQLCVELCARGLQMCDLQAHPEIHSLLCKTIAFLLPYDLEVCQACALLVFCQERGLEAYRTVCLLYTQSSQDLHPHANPVPTNIRFYILQLLKERLCFDPEFWNLWTLRTYCLELISDTALRATVLSEMEEDRPRHQEEEPRPDARAADLWALGSAPSPHLAPVPPSPEQRGPGVGPTDALPETPAGTLAVRRRKRGRRRVCCRQQSWSEDEADGDDDPEFKYNIQKSRTDGPPGYALRRKGPALENHKPVKPERQREYLSRCVKNQIFKRKGRKRRWLQGVPRLDQAPASKDYTVIRVNGRKRGRKPRPKLELSFPENEVFVESATGDGPPGTTPRYETPDNVEPVRSDQLTFDPRGTAGTKEASLRPEGMEVDSGPDVAARAVPPHRADTALCGAVEAPRGLVRFFHNYVLQEEGAAPGEGEPRPPESTTAPPQNGDAQLDGSSAEREEEDLNSPATGSASLSWKEKVIRTGLYSHLRHYCTLCAKHFKGLNVMRHAVSHLRRKQLLCIFCTERFNQFRLAKRHIMEHIDEMSTRAAPGAAETDGAGSAAAAADDNRASVIRNLRILLRRNPGHKSHRSTSGHMWQGAPFRDQQVVIQEDLVIVKDPSSLGERGGGLGGGSPPGEGGGPGDVVYYLCPSGGCDRVFLKMNALLLKHAIKCHMKEDNVLEKTFLWAKGRCIICVRPMDFLQQYKEHMTLHDGPNCHFCYHQDCDHRFVTAQKLKEHVRTHRPLRAQCYNPDCRQVFPSLPALYDHEWRHYIAAPLRQEVEALAGPAKEVRQSSEAPWKQRVKIEELWLQGGKEHKHSAAARHPEPRGGPPPPGDGGAPPAGASAAADGERAAPEEKEEEEEKEGVTERPGGLGDGAAPVNGHAPSAGQALATAPAAASAPPHEESELDVKASADQQAQVLEAPENVEDKAPKCDGPPQAQPHTAPLIRLPPSAYLNETALKMPRRRGSPPANKDKNLPWKVRLKTEQRREAEAAQALAEAAASSRRRCSKCLSSYKSPKELEEHQALNKCSALFDTDDEDE